LAPIPEKEKMRRQKLWATGRYALLALATCFCFLAASASYSEETAGDSVTLRHLFTPIPRPDPEGAPTEVRVAAHIIDLKAIDDAEQTFTADVYLAATWHDPRLVLEDEAMRDSVRTFGADEIWHPGLEIVNLDEAKPLMKRILHAGGDGTVTQLQRLLGTFSIHLNLRDFPFDTQIMPIALTSFFYGPEEVDLKMLTFSRDDRLSISGWTIALAGPESAPGFFKPGNRYYSRLSFNIEAERVSRSYIWKIFFPLALILFMAWTVFWVDPSTLGPQIGLPASTVLSLVFFYQRIATEVPRLSYLTRADRFVLGASLLVFATLAEAIMVSRLAAGGHKRLSRRVDAVSRWVYLVAVGLMVVYATWL
jgi:hypothetical protein